MSKLELSLIDLGGVPNVRELGGYVMPDGGVVRSGVLLRGGLLQKASPAGLSRLVDEFHVTQNFDFRTEQELKYAPDPQLPGVKYTWLPTIDPDLEKLGTSTLPAEAYRNLPDYLCRCASSPKTQDVARRIYRDMVANEYTQLQYAAFLQSVINMKEGAVYWHCSQGKDRTGLGAAFLLAALGADRDLIVEDFNLSNVSYKEEVDAVMDRIHACGGGVEEEKVVMTFIGVNVDYFIDALELIDEMYGSLDDYLTRQLCLTDDDRQALRNRYLEYK